MASEDVIELGSSDDEAEPAPKKKKPMPNAMVHIPNKLPGITIKPSKPNQIRKQKAVSTKPIVINKVFNINSNVNKSKQNKQVVGAFPIPTKNVPKGLKAEVSVTKKCSINPFNLNKNLIRPQLSVPLKSVLNPIKVKGSSLLNNLPPGITIKLVPNAGGSETAKKCKRNAPPDNAEVLTVDIDDEEMSETPAVTTASPQWYIRPEEPSVKKEEEEETKGENESETADSMEEQNNKEPESTKFVEITIEDSPLKPLPSKTDSEIGKELAITIDDSPAKVITHNTNDEGSDNENVKKIPQSKKKLEYPKQIERQVVEIEINLMDTGSVPVEINNDKDTQKDTKTEDENINVNNETASDDSKPNSVEESEQTKETVNSSISTNEFHPVYQYFIDTCFILENSEDMRKIVEKKIKAYYKQCPKEYVESKDFIEMVSSKIVSMKTDPDKMYLYIKDIVDELNLQRKMAKSTIISKKEELAEDSPKTPEYDESVYHSKKRKQIRKLEKTIKKLHRAIQKLETQEVDFDDDEDSVYLLTERYKERMVRVHRKFCQLTNTKMPSEARIHIETRPGRPAGPARRLEKWINKKVPVGSPLPFPDFHDVLRCVRDSNDEDKLGWNEYDIMEEARDLFTRCGKKLQRRRQENEWRLAASRITQNVDPAEENADLNKQLNENRALATSKEVELLNKFAEKQNQLKLEAVEIGDKEAEESPEESDEEEEETVVVSNSLEDKQKRKDKLKKLLQEESKENVEIVKDNKKETEIVEKEEQEEENNETNKTENAEPVSEINTVSSEIPTESIENIKEFLESTEMEQMDNENQNDSDKVESDIDELHLYQKSRKSFSPEHDANSSLASFYSDTLESDSDVETDIKQSDIISIENSSYSESETTHFDAFPNYTSKNVENLVDATFEVEYSKEENVDVVDNVLLASSDEEDTNKGVDVEIGDTCINLKDDNISISETMVFGNTIEADGVISEELFSPDNNIPTTLQESPTNSDINMIQECFEDENDSLNDTAIELSKDNEEINCNVFTKDIVDIGSVSDGTSIASVEMQTDMDNKSSEQPENLDNVTHDGDMNDSSCDSRKSEVEPIS